MNRKSPLPLFLLLISFASWGQNQEVDSLRSAVINHPQKDTTRFRLLISASDYLISNPAESKDYIRQALELATELDFKKGIAEAYCSLTYYFFDRMEYARAVDNGLVALRAYEEIDDEGGLYECYNVLAGVYTSSGDFKKAGEYMNNMQELVALHPNIVEKQDFYYNLAFYALKQNRFREGTEWVTNALAIYKEQNNARQIASCYFLLAKAEEGLKNSEGALKYYQSSIAANRLSDDPNAVANIASAHEGVGRLYIQSKEFRKASLHLDTSFQAANQISSVNMILKIYADRALLYDGQGNFREALKYERLHKFLSDSVLNIEKSRALADAQTKYETEKKEQTIALLGQEKKFQNQVTKILVTGIVLLGLAAVAIFLLQRSRTRKAKELLSIQESVNTKLIEVDKLKSRFFANISHEFRTPLTLIISPIEEKLSSQDTLPKDKISFQLIKRSANRLLELVNQLLELSKLESGFMKLRPEPGNLYSFIMSILSSFDSLADVSHVQYNKDIRIPASTAAFDSDKLEKIINNLVANAFKFSPKNGRVDIQVVALEGAKFIDLVFTVKNQGTIIPAEIREKIFEPFFQAEHRMDKGVPGSGLGLSLVKELVKLHGGDIQVSSSDIEGTAFIVKLAFERVDVPAHSVTSSKSVPLPDEEISAEVTPETDDAKETILIVEDNQDVRRLIQEGLKNHYNILEATTGKEGLERARAESVDLVVSDVMMPMMSGVELCHLLKNDERTSHLPIILLTARADHESKLEGLRTGADDYVTKPFNMQELLARIVNLIVQRKKLVQKYNQVVVVQPHEITVTPLDEQFLQRAIQVVEDNLDNTALGVEKMSEEMGMSRTNLHRKIKAITGLATSEFIQDFRLRRASILIEKKADTILQIAYQVGFNDQSYFTKCFKKKFGKTPRDFANHVR